jgi:uncharacterized protein YdbL (DUF1318 family)
MTLRSTRTAFAAAAMALAMAGAALGTGVLAQSRSADALRASGAVGEQADGFMACVSSCDAATQADIREINAKRAQAYRDVAQRTGVSEAAAGQAAAEKIRASLAPGQYYRPQGGSWTRK